MTIQETIKAIKGLGVTARYSSVYKEFHINYDSTNMKNTGYYTDCRKDALNTAQSIARFNAFNAGFESIKDA